MSSPTNIISRLGEASLDSVFLLDSTKIGVSVEVADVINRAKFGNDRSREYKVTEGRILPCSIGMACRL